MISQSSKLLVARDTVFNVLQALQQSSSFVYNSFTLKKDYIPFQKIEATATQAGFLYVIGGAVDDSDRKTRPGVPGGTFITRQVAVQVAFQRSNVLPDDIPTLDAMVLLREQLLDAVKDGDYSCPQNPAFAMLWQRSETLRDENGVPFHYYMLREANVFETYFTAYFISAHQ